MSTSTNISDTLPISTYLSDQFLSLTPGQVTTIINAVLAVLSTIYPLALVVLLVLVLRNSNASLSWSSTARSIHSSLWPTLLRADSSQTGPNAVRIDIVGWLAVMGSLFVTIAGVVTPLGLGSAIVQTSSYKAHPASYVTDISPLGAATPSRDPYVPARLCAIEGSAVPCPFASPLATPNSSVALLSPLIPDKTTEIWGSSTMGTMNWQWRNYYIGNDGGRLLGPGNTTGTDDSIAFPVLSTVQSQILRDKAFAVEGLVVDMSDSDPGVGFWNHTIPEGLEYGGRWEEEILWLQPETTCVNTNITFEYQLLNVASTITNFNLTDRGGFFNLTHDIPQYDKNGQALSLEDHAAQGAWLSNAYMMMLMGIKRPTSYDGRSWNITTGNASIIPGKMQFVPFSMPQYLNTNSSFNSDADGLNPDNIDLLCRGFGPGDYINTTNVAIDCSYMLGPPLPLDSGVDSNVLRAGDWWQHELHVCASATRARVENVAFSLNGTSRAIPDITVERRPRPNHPEPVLWAMETHDNQFNISQIDPFWGRISDVHADDPTISIFKSPEFYLPAGLSSINFDSILSINTNAGPALAWRAAHQKSMTISTYLNADEEDSSFDYSGAGSFALLRKWKQLILKDPKWGPAQINNLIWTDIMTQNMIGTDSVRKRRGLLEKQPSANNMSGSDLYSGGRLLRRVDDDGDNVSASSPDSGNLLQVAPKNPRITFNFLYAIPAFILLGLWLPLMLAAVGSLVFRSIRLEDFRYLLNQTSIGRAVTGDSALVILEFTRKDESQSPQSSSGEGKEATTPVTTISSLRGAVPVSWSSGNDQAALPRALPSHKSPGSALPTKEWAETSAARVPVGLAAKLAGENPNREKVAKRVQSLRGALRVMNGGNKVQAPKYSKLLPVRNSRYHDC